jgi:hypothetical protein
MLVFILLHDTYKMHILNGLVISDTIDICNISYRLDDNSKKSQGFIGFFDWLRSDDRNIVGIRICYFEHQNYNSILSKFSYVRPIFENMCMEIMFCENKYNSEISGDQDFGNNYVYLSEEGNYLLTFATDHLTESEFNSLMRYVSSISICES